MVVMAALAWPAAAAAQPVWTAADIDMRPTPAAPLTGVEQLLVWPERMVAGADAPRLDDASEGPAGPGDSSPGIACATAADPTLDLFFSLIHQSDATERTGLIVFDGTILGFQSLPECLMQADDGTMDVPADSRGAEFVDLDYAYLFQSRRALLVHLHASPVDPVDQIRVVNRENVEIDEIDFTLTCSRGPGDRTAFNMSRSAASTSSPGDVWLTVWAPWAESGCFEASGCEADSEGLGAFSCPVIGFDPGVPAVSILVGCPTPPEAETVAFVVPQIREGNYGDNGCRIEALVQPDAGTETDGGTPPPPASGPWDYRGSGGCTCRVAGPGGGATGWLAAAAMSLAVFVRRGRRRR